MGEGSLEFCSFVALSQFEGDSQLSLENLWSLPQNRLARGWGSMDQDGDCHRDLMALNLASDGSEINSTRWLLFQRTQVRFPAPNIVADFCGIVHSYWWGENKALGMLDKAEL